MVFYIYIYIFRVLRVERDRFCAKRTRRKNPFQVAGPQRRGTLCKCVSSPWSKDHGYDVANKVGNFFATSQRRRTRVYVNRANLAGRRSFKIFMGLPLARKALRRTTPGRLGPFAPGADRASTQSTRGTATTESLRLVLAELQSRNATCSRNNYERGRYDLQRAARDRRAESARRYRIVSTVANAFRVAH